MKKLYFLPVFSLLAVISLAQSYQGTVEYDKKKQQAFVIDYSYSNEAVQNAVVDKIEKAGYSAKTEKGLFNKNKGFIVFKNTVIPEIDPVAHDYVVKVEQRSRKKEDESTLYLLMMQDDTNLLPTLNVDGVSRAKIFLNGLVPDIEDAKLEMEIRSNEETVTKAEKKFKDLHDEKTELEKKLKKNQDELEKQTKLIENQRISLDALKLKRRQPLALTPSN